MTRSPLSAIIALCALATTPFAYATTPLRASATPPAATLPVDGARCPTPSARFAREGTTDLYCSGSGLWTASENAPIASFDVQVYRNGLRVADFQAIASEGQPAQASSMEQASFSKAIEPGPDGRAAIVPGVYETGLSLTITPIVDAAGRVSARIQGLSTELLAMARVATPDGTIEAPSLSSESFDKTWRFPPGKALGAAFGGYAFRVSAHKPVMP